ncbi:MAG: phospho-N-acetylmuramoyl-pentapeptide-transferase [Clostridia bacterium]|nr:MAG: phospho-N-acetylmuramoyl-pentapeptide-transferase [Clostridia bacterium]
MSDVSRAFGLALAAALVLGIVVLPWLRRIGLGQQVREDGPRAHLQKAGTPTLGGIIFLPAVAVASLLVAGPVLKVVAAMAIMLGFAGIGFTDDLLKVARRRSLGLRARHKLTGQIILSLALATVAVFFAARGTTIHLPGTGREWSLGWLYFPFVVLVLTGASNAVNLTDGLDGLAAGATVVAGLAYVFLAILAGEPDMAVLAASLAGGCLGFLAFNFHPARVFMGDTGSMALGAVVGTLAVFTGTELLLPLVGGIYVIETLSVILQVIFFKLTRKRLFLMSPLHHHFELAGWPEVRVVLAFWLVEAILAAAGVLVWYH